MIFQQAIRRSLENFGFFFLFSLFFSFPLIGQKIITLDSFNKSQGLDRSVAIKAENAVVPLGDYLSLLIDSLRDKSLNEVRALENQFVLNHNLENYDIQFPYWVKVDLEGAKDFNQDCLLMFSSDVNGHHSWGNIEVYLIHENNQIDSLTTGNKVANYLKPVPSELNLAKLSIHKSEKATLYFRLSGGSQSSYLAPDKVNLFLVEESKMPGAFSGYPFKGYFIEHDRKNTFNFLYDFKIFKDDHKSTTVNFINAKWDALEKFDPLSFQQKKDQIYWIKTRLIGNEYLVGQQLFQVSSRSLHQYTFAHIDAYVRRNHGEFQHLKTGENISMTKRDYTFWASLIPIYFNPKDTIDLIIRLEGTHDQSKMGHILLKHIDQRPLFPDQIKQATKSGIFFGVFCFQALFFLLLYFIERDKTNLYLILMVFGCILALTIGDPDRHFAIFPTMRRWAILAWCFGEVIIMMGFIKFTEAYFSYDPTEQISKKWIPGFLSLSFLMALIDGLFIIDYSTYSYQLSVLSHLMQIVGVLFTILLAVKAPIKRGSSKRFYFLAFLPVAICISFTLTCVILGRIPHFNSINLVKTLYAFVIQNGADIVRICMVISFSLFAFSIGYRTNILRADQKMLAEIEKKNIQNELLLKEIHHRVKNNLEVISSLLELQAVQIEDSNAFEAIQASQNRIQSMSLIHQNLYAGENIAIIEMEDYFINLANSLIESYGVEGHIQMKYDIAKIELGADTAIPIGLIVNELLTNSMKYAFPERNSGCIQIKMKQSSEGTYHLMVADDGIGKSNDTPIKGTGFGSKLIKLLVKQLDASMVEKNQNGTQVEIEFTTLQFLPRKIANE